MIRCTMVYYIFRLDDPRIGSLQQSTLCTRAPREQHGSVSGGDSLANMYIEYHMIHHLYPFMTCNIYEN